MVLLIRTGALLENIEGSSFTFPTFLGNQIQTRYTSFPDYKERWSKKLQGNAIMGSDILLLQVDEYAVYRRVKQKRGLPKEVILYQYEVCPFCNKVRAFLDYHKVELKSPGCALEISLTQSTLLVTLLISEILQIFSQMSNNCR